MTRGLHGLRIAAAVAFTTLTMAALVSFAGRNSSGTMTPVNGPYVSGTTILTSDINARFADIENELTGSLSRSGMGSMLAPLRGIDATVAAPSYSWTAEPGSGLFRAGTNDVRMGIGGLLRQQWTATGAAITGTLSASGDVTASTRLGVGAAPVDTFDVTVGAGNNVAAGFYIPTMADGTFDAILIGKSTGAALSGQLTYNKNATLANSSMCMGTWGLPSTLCVDGNGKATVSGSGLQIGASGTGISQSNRGTASWTPATLATTGSCTNTAVTVTGAVQGAECLIGAPAIPFTVAASCAITAANTCTISLCNTSTVSATPPSGTYACRAFNP